MFLRWRAFSELLLGVSAGLVAIFVIFSTFISKSGAGNFFMDLSFALFGRFRGGGAKVSIVSSAQFGSLSGSAVANDGESKTAILTALSSDYRIKHAIAVDEDVNIYDDEQVLWVIATRSQWEKDLVVVSNIMGARLDPSAGCILACKGGIDATKPCDAPYAQKLAIPQSILRRVKLDDYL